MDKKQRIDIINNKRREPIIKMMIENRDGFDIHVGKIFISCTFKNECLCIDFIKKVKCVFPEINTMNSSDDQGTAYCVVSLIE